MNKEDKELVSLEMSKSLHKALKEKAKQEEISFSALVRRILKKYLEKDKNNQ